MRLKNLHDAHVNRKTVLVRVDFNVPILDNLTVGDTTRLKESLETIEYLMKNNAKVLLLSHLGRPHGKKDTRYSLKPVSKALSSLLHKDVFFVSDCIGEKVKKSVKSLHYGEVILLENTRFYSEDEKNSREFAKKLAALAHIFINDAFGTCHRKHASVYGIAQLLPSYAGFLVEKEVEFLSHVLNTPKKPVALLVGGSKIDTKLGLLKHFFDKADTILVGGGIANTFLAAAGYYIGKSLYEKEKLEIAQEIMLESEKKKIHFILPKDVVVASEVNNNASYLDIPIENIEGDMKILDIGKWSIEHYCNHLERSRTVIWNGPLGVFEYAPFAKGTKMIAEMLAHQHEIDTIIGGGDTLEALQKFNIKRTNFTHVSTGGGAMLSFLSGEKLPGLEMLKQK